MISEAFAKKQLERMSQIPGFGFLLPGALTDLKHAIQNADTEAIAARVISDYCDGTACPSASAIRRAMNEENERHNPQPAYIPRCEGCGGSGFIHVTKGLYSGVRDCRCRIERLNAIKEQSK